MIVIMQCMYEQVCVFITEIHTHTPPFSQCLFFPQQFHMGKQAEEQQKYGERVGPKYINKTRSQICNLTSN